MDKSTLSNYGWIVIVTLVLSVMLALATPFGSYVGRGASNVIKFFTNITEGSVDSDNIKKQSNAWDKYLNDEIAIEEIEANPHIFAIGKTKPEYVIATFNSDYTKVTVSKNGNVSDGIIQDFDPYTTSPFYQHKDTLKNIVVNEGVEVIGLYTFYGCSQVAEVSLPESLRQIRNFSFAYCTNVKSFHIPKNVEYVTGHAFADQNGFETLTVDKNNKYFVMIDGILYSKDLTTLVYAPPSNQLVTFTVPDTVKVIGYYAFLDMKTLESIVLPNGLTTIQHNAFGHCVALKDLEIPASVQFLDRTAFASCYAIEEMVIPDGITEIDIDTFYYCIALKSITIPTSVETIDETAFTGCRSLTTVYGKTGSYAETWANAKGYTFITI